MKYLNTIILILLSTISIAQNKDQFNDSETLCKQIDAATNYLENQKSLKTVEIKYDKLIRDGWNYDSFASDYLSYKLNIPKKEILEKGSEESNKIYRRIEESKYKSGVRPKLECLKKQSKSNSIISKIDEETMIIQVGVNRTRKQGSSGRLYLFIFDKNSKIKQVFEKVWIN